MCNLAFVSSVEALTFPPSSGKSFIMGADEALESELGLGELAGLTVANEADSLAYDVSSCSVCHTINLFENLIVGFVEDGRGKICHKYGSWFSFNFKLCKDGYKNKLIFSK